MATKAKITEFGLQKGTERTLFAKWSWSKKIKVNSSGVPDSNGTAKETTDHYEVRWYYYTGNGVRFEGSFTTSTNKVVTWSAPDNATSVRFKVKPIAKKYKKNNKEVAYWTADWSTEKEYKFKAPDTPAVPTVGIQKYKLTAELDITDTKTKVVQFQIVRDDKKVCATINAVPNKVKHVSISLDVIAGHEYKVRARAFTKYATLGLTPFFNPSDMIIQRVPSGEHSDWSEYSETVQTIPGVPSPSGMQVIATSSTSVRLSWTNVPYAKNYKIEYTTATKYFGSSPSNVQSFGPVSTLNAEITGLEPGKTYYFRVCAINDAGESDFNKSPYPYVTIGKKPEAPTTWSSTTTAISGDDVILYWVHNTADGSHQTEAEISLTVNGNTTVIKSTQTTPDEETEKTYSYKLNTSSYTEGVKIQWKIRTKGILNSYSDWSIERSIEIFSPATIRVETNLVDSLLQSYPLVLQMYAGPTSQKPIGYNVSIISKEHYSITDEVGNAEIVTKDQVIYNKTIDTSQNGYVLTVEPSDVRFNNNISYLIVATVTMNSGLSAMENVNFTTALNEEEYDIDAYVEYDGETYSAIINPYCETTTIVDDEEFISQPETVELSVYRREVNGSFVPIMTGIQNGKGITVVDPHPALDYMRYRVVATSTINGTQEVRDIPVKPVGETSIIIQWDETYTDYSALDDDGTNTELPISSSILILPYNIDVSDDYNNDVSLVEYSGRERPVSYYGTQKGHSSTWKTDIIKADDVTMNAVRRLSNWSGDCYVREPSGTGYWANISVSMSQTHANPIVPVTFKVQRVEGGV